MAQQSPPSAPRRRQTTRLLLPMGIVAIVVLAYAATRPLGGGAHQASFVVIGSAGAGVQIGQLAPGTARAGAPLADLVGLDDQPRSLTAFEDHPIWLIFWKTACEPCEAEAQDVAAAAAAHAGDGLAVIGVDVWDSVAVVRDYAAGHDTVETAVATGPATMDAYGVWGAPTHYFIDRDGIIRDRYFGPMTRQLIDESLGRIL